MLQGPEPRALPPTARRRAALLVTPGQLTTFGAVAELGSVRAAAQQLSVTESAVSAALAALQRQLGTALLERVGRGVRLTPAGVSYARYAHRILGLLEQGALAAIAEAEPGHGTLRVAAVTSAGEFLLPPLLASFRAQHPDVGLDLEVAPRDRVWELLRRHAVDLAVAGRPPSEGGVWTYALRPNKLVVVAAPETAAGTTDLATVPWLLREPGSGTRETLVALLDTLGGHGSRLTLGSNGAVISGAIAGLGATLASRDVVAPDLQDGRLVELAVPGTPLDRPFHLVGHREITATAALFADHALASGEWRSARGEGASPRSTPRTRGAQRSQHV
jgi:DNA-binding transcriptional LysR family regulator